MANIAWSPSRNVDALFTYLRTPKKNQTKDERNIVIVGVNGTLPSVAEKQFRDVRKKWGKDSRSLKLDKDGVARLTGQFVQGYHGVLGFGADELDPSDPESWEKVISIATRLIKKCFPTRQAMLFLQNDGDGSGFGEGGKLHVHIVLNSIEKETGRSLDSNLVTHAYAKVLADGTRELAGMALEVDAVLAERGMKQSPENVAVRKEAEARVIAGGSARMRGKVKREKSEGRELIEYRLWEARQFEAAESGMAFDEPEPFSVAVLKQRIEEALADESVLDLDSLKEKLAELRINFLKQPGQQGLSYAMVDENGVKLSGAAGRAASKLGRSFMFDAVMAQLDDNREAVLAKPPVAPAFALVSAVPVSFPAPMPAVAPVAPTQREPDAVLADQFIYDLYSDEWVPDYNKMEERYGLTMFEADQALADWEALGRPETAFNREMDALLADVEKLNSRGHKSTFLIAPEPLALPVEPIEGQAENTDSSLGASYVSMLADPAIPALRNPRTQETLDGFAAYEPQAVAALQHGERLDETKLKGIGAEFIAKYREVIHPDVLEQLDLREDKKAMRSEQHETRVAASSELEAGKDRAKDQGEFGWESSATAKKLELQRDRANERHKKLTAEMAQGIYEVVPEVIMSRDEGLLDRRNPDQERTFGI